MAVDRLIPEWDDIAGAPLDSHIVAYATSVFGRSGISNLRSGPDPAYRFSYLDSWGKTFFVEVGRRAQSITVEARPSGDPAGLPSDFVSAKSLTEHQWDHIDGLVSRSGFWSNELPEPGYGCDGTVWLLEGFAQDRYHLQGAWCPGRIGAWSRFRQACEAIARASDNRYVAMMLNIHGT